MAGNVSVIFYSSLRPLSSPPEPFQPAGTRQIGGDVFILHFLPYATCTPMRTQHHTAKPRPTSTATGQGREGFCASASGLPAMYRYVVCALCLRALSMFFCIPCLNATEQTGRCNPSKEGLWARVTMTVMPGASPWTSAAS